VKNKPEVSSEVKYRKGYTNKKFLSGYLYMPLTTESATFSTLRFHISSVSCASASAVATAGPVGTISVQISTCWLWLWLRSRSGRASSACFATILHHPSMATVAFKSLAEQENIFAGTGWSYWLSRLSFSTFAFVISVELLNVDFTEASSLAESLVRIASGCDCFSSIFAKSIVSVMHHRLLIVGSTKS